MSTTLEIKVSAATEQRIVTALTEKPRQTAIELNVALHTLRALEARGVIEDFGPRGTGKRGKPPREFIISGSRDEHGSPEQARQQDALKRCADFREWRRSFDKLSDMRLRGESATEAYAEAREAHYERWPMGTVPPTPNATDLANAGLADDEAETDILAVA
jgi:hypothetical protein